MTLFRRTAPHVIPSRALRTGWFLALGCLALGAGPSRAFNANEVSAILQNEVTSAQVGGAPAVWMAREWDIEMDGSGNYVVIQHHLLRVFDEAYATEHLRPFRLNFWSQSQRFRPLALRVWSNHREYRAIEPEQVAEGPSAIARQHPHYEMHREVTIDFGEVRANEVVELIVQWDYSVIPGEYNTRWLVHEFGDALPTVEEQVTFRLPTAFEPDFGQSGHPVRQITRALGGQREHSWLTGHLPAGGQAVMEGPVSRVFGAAPSADSLTTIAFTTGNWTYLSTYLGRYWEHHASKTGNRLNAVVSRLIEGAKDQRARLDRIVTYMQDEVETLPIHHALCGMRPLDSSVVVEGSSGSPRDKTCALVAMLRAAGLTAQPVMIRTRTSPWAESVGCPDQLDRFLVHVRLNDDTEVWCDPVEDETPLPEGRGFYISFPVPEGTDPEPTGTFTFPGRP